MKIEIIENISEFEALKDEWEKLFVRSRCQNIFLSFAWHFNWWKHFGDKKALAIVSIVEKGETVGIAPLCIEKKFGFNCLSFIGSYLSDFEGFLVESDEGKTNDVVLSILESLKNISGWDIFRLKKIKKSSCFFEVLQSWQKNNDFLVNWDMHKEGAPYLENPGSWDDYAKQLKSKFLSDSRRRMNKLLKRGDVVYSGKTIDSSGIDSLMEKLKYLHIKRRNMKGENSFLEDERCFNFFLDLAKLLNEKGVLHLSSFSVEEQPVAIHFGFRVNDYFGYQIPVFNQDYKPYAVSRLLLMELIRESFNNGVQKFDFMLGDEGYKNDWNPKVEELYFLTCVPKTIRGQIAKFIFYNLNLLVKKIRGRSF